MQAVQTGEVIWHFEPKFPQKEMTQRKIEKE